MQAASVGALIEASFQGVDMVNEQLSNALGVYWVDLPSLKALRPDVILTQLQVCHCTFAFRAALRPAF